jgi:LysR family transcriptional regulator, transcriptional activator of the cysJI operon
MFLDRIQLFVSAAKHRNLAKTAREMHVSASSVCQRLKSLENDFGVKLYKRTNTGIEVTEEGETLLAIASDVLNNFETLKAKFRRNIDAPERVLKVGGTYNPSARDLPSAIATFQKAFPDAKVNFLTSTKAEIEKSLHERQLDIAVIQSPSKSADLVMEPFAVDSLIFFSHPGHPLAHKKSVDLLDLNHTAVVIRGERGTTERFVEKLKSRGITLNVSLRCVSPDAVKAAVRREMGIGILFHNLVEDELKRKEFKVLKFRSPIAPVGNSFIVYNKKQPLSSAANEFLAILRSMKDRLATATKIRQANEPRQRSA